MVDFICIITAMQVWFKKLLVSSLIVILISMAVMLMLSQTLIGEPLRTVAVILLIFSGFLGVLLSWR